MEESFKSLAAKDRNMLKNEVEKIAATLRSRQMFSEVVVVATYTS